MENGKWLYTVNSTFSHLQDTLSALTLSPPSPIDDAASGAIRGFMSCSWTL